MRWLWGSGAAPRVARLPLVPLAALYWSAMKLRAAGYHRDWRARHRLPLPTVAVGNLAVGGAGKTPLAAWIARYYADQGRTPGILLRGYGGDESLVHRRLESRAVVAANPDRIAGARQAQAAGADVLILDDAFQLLSVERDLSIVAVSAESVAGSPWPLPAGPWRERWDALGRADLAVVTRKRAPPDAAEALARRLSRRRPEMPVCVAHLALARLEGMRSGTRHPVEVVAGRRVLAAAGVADPESFAGQLRALGADVQLVAHQDHHPYAQSDVTRLAGAARGGSADYVVVTEKDAVKLRGRWPEDAPEPLVAGLAVRWERNAPALAAALDAVVPQLPV